MHVEMQRVSLSEGESRAAWPKINEGGFYVVATKGMLMIWVRTLLIVKTNLGFFFRLVERYVALDCFHFDTHNRKNVIIEKRNNRKTHWIHSVTIQTVGFQITMQSYCYFRVYATVVPDCEAPCPGLRECVPASSQNFRQINVNKLTPAAPCPQEAWTAFPSTPFFFLVRKKNSPRRRRCGVHWSQTIQRVRDR